ncbi:M23 family metallopeptidase [Leptospira sp. GIMC2001]|uniref:M23 family metallopeptidase n=1 Tax=Leptospira sp. GIMC2001 TaxID=1513297 RepID=UPI0023493EA6|nr:M23 family metallopeptidase [Leptospira sp. GIMC2001]WCL48472.1 M23 family metallopeptidase [Leptospira sp. GIMC2001]
MEKNIFLSKAQESILRGVNTSNFRDTDWDAVYKVMHSSDEFTVAAAANHIHRLGINNMGARVESNTIKLTEKELPTQNPNLVPGEGFVRTDNIYGVPLLTPGDPNASVTSPMGWRNDPITGKPLSWHSGVDVGSPLGTPIGFPTEGKVVSIKTNDEKTPFKPGHGNQVVIQIQNSDYAYSISHNSTILVKEGDTVKPGQAISLSGNSGRTSGGSNRGYHTHVEIYKYNPARDEWRSITPSQDDLNKLQGLVGSGQ